MTRFAEMMQLRGKKLIPERISIPRLYPKIVMRNAF